jgi:hypothetical protein
LFSIFLLTGFSRAAGPDFHKDIQPLLASRCLKCHGAEKQKGGLRLDTREGYLAKGDSGALAVVPGQPSGSELLLRVGSSDKLQRMPPSGEPLTAAEVAMLRAWVESGAPGPEGKPAPAAQGKTEMVVTAEDRRHWSFLPLGKVEPPGKDGQGWCKTPVDRFILAGLAAKGLEPSAPADARTLIRRVTYDLTGLPPTPEEVDAFLGEGDRQAAYEALLDRLLASPRYGERWARHWLDVARYADSGGYEGDHDRPTAFHYRDFVIDALNRDMPFDEFVRWQLAGDEIAPDDPRAVAATGFLAAGPGEVYPDRLLEEERIRLRYNELDDMVSTTGAALLGLTVGCSRCHDHKFDPIPARDYYRMLAGLNSGNRAEVPVGTRAEAGKAIRTRADWEREKGGAESVLREWLAGQRRELEPGLRRARVQALKIPDGEKRQLLEKPESPESKSIAKRLGKSLAVSDDEIRAAGDEAARRRGGELSARLAEWKAKEPQRVPTALAFRDHGPRVAESWLFGRGDFHDRSTPVELGFLTVLIRDRQASDYWDEARASPERDDSTQQRRAMAAWMTDVEKGAGPLLARVIVNRIWQHHFGEGLVRTPNDFGVRGERPTHPELLEWLASDLSGNGWRLKRLHRTILLSAAYRQGGRFDPEKSGLDPDNRLLWRMRPHRLEAESLRDSMLAVSGTLNLQMHGPSFKAPIPADAMVARNLKNPYPLDIPDSPAVRRRSVYMFHKRVIPHPLLQAFDSPDAQQCSGQRAKTTVVPQALAMLNDPFVRARATDLADRLVRERGADSSGAINRAYLLALSRPAKPPEAEAGLAFLAARERERQSRAGGTGPDEPLRQALTDYCQVLLGLNEFLYID